MRARGIDNIRFNTVIKDDNLDQLLPIVEEASDPLGVTDLMTHEVSIDEAPAAYKNFQKKTDGTIKVVLKPQGVTV